MTAAYEDGELLDITLKGVRVGGNGIPASERKLYVDLGPWSSGIHRGSEWFLTLPIDSPKVVVSRVAPREWPPQPGDIWENGSGTSWWACYDPDGTYLRSAMGGTSDPDTILEDYGPLSLAYRKGWSPEPAPAADEPEKLDERAEMAAGLRDLADWLEANPDVPLPYNGELLTSINKGTDEADHADLLRIAEVIGEPANLAVSHPAVRKLFRGRVTYRAFYIPTAKPDDEASRAGDPDLAPEVPAVATAQPGLDIAGEGGEAAAPAGESGAAAATETATGVNLEAPVDGTSHDAGVEYPASDVPAAAPAPVASGDGPAVAPDGELVWVAVERKGVDYHAIGDGHLRAVCGRSIRQGMERPLWRAQQFAKPCPRCYPHSPAGAGVA